MKIVKEIIFTVLCLLTSGVVTAQTIDTIQVSSDSITVSPVTDQTADTILAVQPPVTQTQVFLEHANTLSFDKAVNPDAQLLRGNVRFRHDSSYMYCDSALFFEQNNSLEAFGNVRMEQGDTLFVYGDYLFYNGNTQIAYLRDQVRMENGQVTLFTDSLNYERIPDIGYYFDGGMIVDSVNQLSSYYGQYSPTTKLAVFNDSVKLDNPNFILYSDTLHYDTETKIATILGPSVIVSDSGTIHSSRGWYNTIENTALLLDHSRIESGDNVLVGDSIFYNQESGFGQVYGQMFMTDTAQHITITGDYGYYNERTGYAFATENAIFMEYSQGDTLYLHADTLEMTTIDDDFREIKAFYGVRFYRHDLQGVCDSLQFNTRDSVLFMYTQPIIWNEEYQLYGDTIAVYMNDSTIDYAHVIDFAFAAQFLDTTYYNQLKGNDLKAYFDGQQLSQIDIVGNAESIFYPLEKDGAMIGLNETKSGFLTIWLKDNQLDKLKIWPSPTGSMTPIPDLNPAQKQLRDFHWFDYLRPKDKDDIFTVVKRKEEETPKRSNKFIHEQ